MMARRFVSFRPILAVSIALLALLPAGWAQPAAADISGNTYTSPTYGYTVTWDDTWFVVEESTEDFDSLTLTNGLTFGTFLGVPDTSPTPESALAGFVIGLRAESTIIDVAPLRDSAGDAIRGGDDAHAFAAFTYTLTLDDGTLLDLADYIEVRPLVPGESIVGFTAQMPVENFESERPQWEQLLAGLSVPGGGDVARTVPAPDEPAAAEGEPAPVFVSGPWRVAVATSALNDALAGAGLDEKAGKEWLVVVLDVTNWSDDDAELAARDFTLGIEGAAKPIKIAPSSTKSVAARLEVAPTADDLAAAIDAGESERVVLVFSLPARSRAPELRHGNVALPLADTLDVDLQTERLPAPARPPEVTEGEIVSASDGKTMRVQLEGESDSQRIQLLGIEPPAENACFEHEAEKVLDGLVGTAVLVEEDAALTGGNIPVRYVWLTDDGARTLLNQRLIAEGKAAADAIPNDARFGLWFGVTERAAEEGNIGLWSGC